MPLTQAGVVPSLLARGLIDEGLIVDADLLVLNASRRNVNFKVVSERGPSYFVKQGVGPDRVRTVAREAAVYELLASSPALQPVAGFLPRCHLYDADECTLVLDLVASAKSLADYHRQTLRFPPVLGTALGRALGTLHRLTRTAAARAGYADRFRSHTPGILQMHRPTLEAFTWMSHATFETIKMVQQSEGLRAALDALCRDWREDALIHSDARWDNCLVIGADRPPREMTVKLVDWEMAGAGDPCWDVGTVFGEYLSFWLVSSPVVRDIAPEDVVRLAPFPLRRIQPAIRAFWRSYAREMGLDGGENDEWCLRAVRYAGARLIQTAYERMLGTARVTEEAVYLLQLSANILEQPLDAAAQLFGLPVVPPLLR